MPDYQQRDGYVVFGPEAVSAPFSEVQEALEDLRDSTRLVVFEVSGTPGAERWSGDELIWFERYPLPTIAALSGEVGGGALDIALECDIRVAAADAVLRFRTIANRRMLTLLGTDRSVEVLERRGQVDASTALDCGLVSQVSPSGEAVLVAAEALARTIASRGPLATQLAKEAIWRGLELPFEHALRFETDLTLLLQTTNDRAEGVRAFIEKRAPQFTGK